MSLPPSQLLTGWALLLLFGALQGGFLALSLLLHPRGKKVSNRLLAILLLIFSLHLTEYVLLASGLYTRMPWAIGLSLPAIFLIGPLYYFYSTTLLTASFPIDLQRLWHFVPALLCYLLLLPFYAESPNDKIAFLGRMITDGFVIFPLGLFILLALSTCQMLLYFYLAYNAVSSFEQNYKQRSADTAILSISWLKIMSLWFSIYMMLFFVAYFQFFLLKPQRPEILYLALLILSLFIHAVAFHAIRQPEIFAGALGQVALIKYQKTALPERKSKAYLARLLQVMEGESPYLEPDLKLAELAERLRIQPNHLSQVINAELGKNFFDFVNRYRIEEAKRRLLDKRYAHYSILAIALDAGFNNKASFNRVFKKETGMTPSDFAKKYRAAEAGDEGSTK